MFIFFINRCLAILFWLKYLKYIRRKMLQHSIIKIQETIENYAYIYLNEWYGKWTICADCSGLDQVLWIILFLLICLFIYLFFCHKKITWICDPIYIMTIPILCGFSHYILLKTTLFSWSIRIIMIFFLILASWQPTFCENEGN